ncbi:DUF3316 domain-containing protein [Vibrio europaeus]|uniref:Acyl-CoA synthetase n=1 Tax=Vibrio europaeus TaxID=300876 RepID=A0A178J8E4_9VIBR|nr:DUF3316 domain-containing protein [Vibrio europaeus]MDC5705029.1 DUF3316 domain-containing protein [Vibrio europaeus]MDC5710308.1 DUF3316 domain-containing protein [Vibrio europaeus]MDC5715398.1 DUF3316 domain-containing protein [Vibrio europaeus]MDC5719559.1 DUF3316 domain-containing protein [Vibrio europaeus]MDC5724553.1 DUF3316 domain-containing protein [Vibrio europaeus]
MKKVILLASLVMSASVFASTSATTSNTSFTTDAYSTKQQAYDAAFDLMDEMKTLNPAQLKTKLHIPQNNVVYPSVKLNDMTVQIEEFASAPGNIQYKAILDVDYQYKYRESGNS